MIAAAFDVATRPLDELAAQRLAEILGDRLYFEVRNRRSSALCRLLATAARKLLKAPDIVQKTAGDLAAEFVRACDGTEVEQEIARQGVKILTRPLTAVGKVQLVTTAYQLRGIGILICIARDRLESCRCAQDHAKDLTKAALETFIMQLLQGNASPPSEDR